MLKNNIIIGGLLAIVFLMIVGYVASASNLSITSTASTTKDIQKYLKERQKITIYANWIENS